jgi:hypothetical protein
VDIDLSRAKWRTSTYSNGSGGNCVEVALNLPGIAAVRDSKNHTGAVLAVSERTWSEFIQTIKDGNFGI